VSGRLPSFLVIGAAKSGTTALWAYLRQHPDVFMPDLKEPHHFAFPPDRPAPAFQGPGATIHEAVTDRSAYEALFAGAGTARAVGEASALYLYLPDAAERIATAIPEVRLVAVLRQPAERAFSSFQHLRRQGREPAESFEEGLAREAERIRDGWGFLWRYRDLGHYPAQLRRYRERVPADRLLVHLYDDLVEDPLGVVQRTYRFLGVDSGFGPDLSARLNVGGVPRSGWRGQLLGRGSPLRRASGRLLPRRLRRRVGALADRQALERASLDPATRRSLTEEFRPEIEELAALLGRDLGAWLAEPRQPSPPAPPG
jgi:hypothetical protein